jgi:hypothetical protein
VQLTDHREHTNCAAEHGVVLVASTGRIIDL